MHNVTGRDFMCSQLVDRGRVQRLGQRAYWSRLHVRPAAQDRHEEPHQCVSNLCEVVSSPLAPLRLFCNHETNESASHPYGTRSPAIWVFSLDAAELSASAETCTRTQHTCKVSGWAAAACLVTGEGHLFTDGLSCKQATKSNHPVAEILCLVTEMFCLVNRINFFVDKAVSCVDKI